MKKTVYYLKVNIEREWLDYPEGFDWNKLQKGEDIGYFDYKILNHLKNAKKGDIVVLHSVKEERGKSQNPNVVGFGIISQERKYDKDRFVTRVMKVKDLAAPIPIRDLKKDNVLTNAEPFKKGSNRCPVTKLSDSEYQHLKEILVKLNVIHQNDFDELEKIEVI